MTAPWLEGRSFMELFGDKNNAGIYPGKFNFFFRVVNEGLFWQGSNCIRTVFWVLFFEVFKSQI